jgi:hypothetical protein
LREACVRPLAAPSTAGAWYRGHRLMAIDGSSLSVPDEVANRRHFGLPGASRGQAGFPKLRLSVLMELGTRAPLAWCGGPWCESEMEQAERLVVHLEPGMLMLADRYDGGFPLWSQAQDRGADLLWRVKSNQAFPAHGSFPDGSWSSVINGSGRDRRRLRGQRAVRVVRYRMPGSEEAFTLITTLLDPEQAPAAELAALYHERWEIETAYDEVKTHMLGPGALLRSKTPELVLQELDGLMLAHYAVRCLIHEAAASAGRDPDRLSFLHAVNVVRRRIVHPGAFSPTVRGFDT